MAKNDLILLDGILDNYMAKGLPSTQKGEAFEYLTYQQVLKDYDISHDDILFGSVDGKDDGGIDAIYMFVNGHLVTDINNAFLPKATAELEIYFFTCKHADSFKQEPVNSIIVSFEELLDFSLTPGQMKGSYNSDVLEKRNCFHSIYRKIGPVLSSFRIYIVYACRGDTSKLGENIHARSEQATTLCNRFFSACIVQFQFWGSLELLESYRKIQNYSLELNFHNSLTLGKQYILLVKLQDYYKFITTEELKLRKYLFDSNVRDFMGINAVNEDILDTLKDAGNTDFWWLNNGVTILSTAATIIGNSIHIENVQIVNGLQTSECIYRHFSTGIEADNRHLLIKVLTSQDNNIRDSIIRATNNQTRVNTASLHATDKIQRDIEDILFKYGMYYERRINYYANQGIPGEKIFSPLYLASGYIALVRKLPYRAVTLKTQFMRNPKQYENVFSHQEDLNIWPRIASILRTSDTQLKKMQILEKINFENYLKSVRYIVSLITVARLLGTFNYSIPELASLGIQKYTEDEVKRTWEDMQNFLPQTWNKANWRKKFFTTELVSQLALLYNLPGVDTVVKRNDTMFNNNSNHNQYDITDAFLDEVSKRLPIQPWPTGIHKTVAQELNAPIRKVSQAINVLIIRKIFRNQINGVLFNDEGAVIAIDPERRRYLVGNKEDD